MSREWPLRMRRRASLPSSSCPHFVAGTYGMSCGDRREGAEFFHRHPRASLSLAPVGGLKAGDSARGPEGPSRRVALRCAAAKRRRARRRLGDCPVKPGNDGREKSPPLRLPSAPSVIRRKAAGAPPPSSSRGAPGPVPRVPPKAGPKTGSGCPARGQLHDPEGPSPASIPLPAHFHRKITGRRYKDMFMSADDLAGSAVLGNSWR